MKKKFLVKSALLWVMVLSAALVGCALVNSFGKRDLSFDVLPFLVTKTPYPKRSIAKKTPLLQECKPIHINHVGRHGSRHLSKTLSEEVISLIERADKSSQLKAPGKGLPAMIRNTRSLENPTSLGQLTNQGREEQRNIAERMYESYKEIFADPHKPILLRSTRIQRTKESLTVFWEKLISLQPSLANQGLITMAEAGPCDPHLRFFEGCDAYRHFIDSHYHKAALEQAFQKRVMPAVTSVMQRLFKQPFIDSLEQKTKILIVRNFYELCQLQADLNRKATKNGFCSIFTNAREIEPFSWYEDVSYYLNKGPNSENPIPKMTACVLLKDFIDTSERALRDSKAPAAHLRFAHAETMMPFLSLLGLYSGDTFASLLENPEHRVFKSSEASPMAANVQWILYRCPHEDYQVRMRVNEQDVKFPIEACTQNEACAFTTIKNYYEKNNRTCDENTWAIKICKGTSCAPASTTYPPGQ